MDMYAKCDEVGKALNVLEEVPVHDMVSLNALISSYVHYQRDKDVLKYLDLMIVQCEGIFPDIVTFTCILKVCGVLGEFGRVNESTMRSFVKVYWKRMLCLGECFR